MSNDGVQTRENLTGQPTAEDVHLTDDQASELAEKVTNEYVVVMRSQEFHHLAHCERCRRLYKAKMEQKKKESKKESQAIIV